ncbi:MAG: UDP-N-acetylmuramate:L-alanyl-gamma-D-glutamyl-meso-diaminopimelate ligase [Desulfobacterales bacterium]|nr:UDP-N-acetylmuramate:L-alanyl-gamma-D-glutamyl-meso-diaminopimelate ligase [Desulfobacterales bacterium]MDX2513176.1 UDP-N-acetylmuramate:L-alanyl-gamma-D-glutamyl-meso-diaminopimelate ligase [Desulfobacterales bacterium]
MDLDKNKIPKHVQSIHLIAVCGTGMGALACMLKDLGYAVTGSDQHVYPPMSTFLEEKGISLSQGFQPENLAYGPDLVVVGNAVSKDNPEVVEMVRKGLHFCSMPQAVNAFAGKGKQSILVTGTHGKTTTSSLIAWLLHCAGMGVSFVIGGILANFDSNYFLGAGDYLVVEGDEYDTAFFDKGPKFMHYDPAITVLTGVEFDHADIFSDLDQIKKAFSTFVSGLRRDTVLVAYQHDNNVDHVIQSASCDVYRYGNDGGDWSIKSVRIEPPWTIFDVTRSHAFYGRFQTPMPGDHNLSNTLAAIAVADRLNIPGQTIRDALKSFKGVKRRQEIRGIKNGVVVIDDFAHHPTAVKKTIQAIKAYYRESRLTAVFEPRTNTSMRNIFQNEYTEAFDSADRVCIRKPALLKKIPPEERFSSERLVDDLNKRGLEAVYFENTERIIDFLEAESGPGDVILVMSNGGFDNIHEKLLERL